MQGPLGSFLEKFLRLERDRKAAKKLFIESVRANSGVELKEGQITIKESTVFVDGPAALKNELFINKEKILEHFNKHSLGRLETIR